MRLGHYLALAFISGVHGFAMFAPYLLTFVAVVHVARSRGLRPLLVPIPVRAHRAPWR